MRETIELTRRKSHGYHPMNGRYMYSDRLDSRISRYNEPYEYTLRVGDNYCRVVEDWHMLEMRASMTDAEYNRYITDRLTSEMLNHIGGTIKQALKAQAAANAPVNDNMAYLFKD